MRPAFMDRPCRTSFAALKSRPQGRVRRLFSPTVIPRLQILFHEYPYNDQSAEYADDHGKHAALLADADGVQR